MEYLSNKSALSSGLCAETFFSPPYLNELNYLMEITFLEKFLNSIGQLFVPGSQ